jgi:choline dehydrogenase-like flavoprotein
MIFGRASSTEYDQWEVLGSKGWNWASLLKYFKKSENVTPGQAILPGVATVPGSSPSYGKNGPIQISFVTNSTFPSGLLQPWVNSIYKLGSKPNADPVSRVGLHPR